MSAKDEARQYPSTFTQRYHHTPYPGIAPSKPELSAAGKIVVVTGGGSGIDKAISAAFIEANAAAIVIIGRTESRLKATVEELTPTSANTQVSYLVADVINPMAIERAFSTVLKEYGAIDILISNAGYLDSHQPVAKAPLEDTWRGFEINIKGPIVTTQAFIKVAQPGATLITVSSIGAVHRYIPRYSGYSASKLGAIKIMEYVHYENSSLRVFSIQPGMVDTAMAKKAAMGVPEGGWDVPELPAAFCVWLASPEAEFLRGRFICANWDVEELKSRALEI